MTILNIYMQVWLETGIARARLLVERKNGCFGEHKWKNNFFFHEILYRFHVYELMFACKSKYNLCLIQSPFF
jgi:hypothetical protein